MSKGPGSSLKGLSLGKSTNLKLKLNNYSNESEHIELGRNMWVHDDKQVNDKEKFVRT